MNKIQHVKVGNKISNIETYIDGFGRKGSRVKKKYIVIGVYPYHVLTRDTKTGAKRSFS